MESDKYQQALEGISRVAEAALVAELALQLGRFPTFSEAVGVDDPDSLDEDSLRWQQSVYETAKYLTLETVAETVQQFLALPEPERMYAADKELYNMNRSLYANAKQGLVIQGHGYLTAAYKSAAARLPDDSSSISDEQNREFLNQARPALALAEALILIAGETSPDYPTIVRNRDIIRRGVARHEGFLRDRSTSGERGPQEEKRRGWWPFR